MDKLNSARAQKGVAGIELTLALPLLLFFFGIICELGRLYIQHETLTKAVRAGVRYATQDTYGDGTYDSITSESEIKGVVVYGDVDGGTDAVLPNFSSDDVTVSHSNGYVKVEAVYQYDPLFFDIPIVTASFNLKLKALSVMRTKQ